MRTLAPDFPLEDVLLDDGTDSQDDGLIAYRMQFKCDTDDPHEVLLCTHAMIAYDLLYRMRQLGQDEPFNALRNTRGALLKQLSALRKEAGSDEAIQAQRQTLREELASCEAYLADMINDEEAARRLPAYRTLLVDEAHLLESSFSNVFSEYLSLRAALTALDNYHEHGGGVSKKEFDRTRELVDMIAAASVANGALTPLATAALTEVRFHLAELHDIFEKFGKKRVTASMNRLRLQAKTKLQAAARLLNAALTHGINSAYLNLSPMRAHPQVYVARDNVGNRLRLLWSGISAGACLSATLYLDYADGPSPKHMRGILEIPEDQLAKPPPIVTTWLRAPLARVDIPTGRRAEALTPPTTKDRLSAEQMQAKMQSWHQAVAGELVSIRAMASGGTLVLCTSHETVSQLGVLLHQAGLQDNLVPHREGGLNLKAQTLSFLSLSRQGKKPIWLATGGAWTGLDVGGHVIQQLLGVPPIAPGDDHIFTDLVIPRLPFGTNQSITHKRRVMSPSTVPWDMLDAAFRFKQGLGRLVRRKGLPKNRHIWVLDGRLAKPFAKQQLALFWNVLNKYG